MLAIARALLARPALMLMDEPSLGLSPKLTKEIFDIVVRINRERGVTILLVEQNAHMALKIADFGYVLEVGRIVMEDTGSAACREGRYPRILSRHEGRRRERDSGDGKARSSGDDGGRRAADTVPKMFWHGVTARGAQVALAPEAVRHLAEHHLGRVRPDRARDRHGARRARLRAGRVRLGALQHQPRMALRRHGHPRRRRRVERHLSDRRAGAGRISLRGFRHGLSVRRGRRAARQGAGSARAPAEAAQDHRVRHGRPARLQRPAGDEPRRAARARARIRRGASGRMGAAHRAAQGRPTSRC